MAGSSSALEEFEKLIFRHLKAGTKVEISSNDEGFRGSFFSGTIMKDPKKSRNSSKHSGKSASYKALVEYDTLFRDHSGKTPLVEEINVVQLRPIPPRATCLSFDLSEEVDAYYNEGWWEGVVTQLLPRGSYGVFFRATREELVFDGRFLRLHREWVHGNWDPPLHPHQTQRQELISGKPSMKPTDYKYSPGELVEVSSDEDGFQDAWFAAKIVERLYNGDYLVEYKYLRNDEDTDFAREEADSQHIRPPPPHIEVDRFEVLQVVDALHNDGWWVGVVYKVLSSRKYVVYFNGTKEKLEFKPSDLRPHQDWIDDKWVIPPKAVMF